MSSICFSILLDNIVTKNDLSYAVYSGVDFAHSYVFCDEYERKCLIFEDPQSELGEPEIGKMQNSLRTSIVDFLSLPIRSVSRTSQQPLYLEAKGTRILSTKESSMFLSRELDLAFPRNRKQSVMAIQTNQNQEQASI
ncbi:hypothetical protein ROZALSC1DRAFT_24949 [Rozella allomycis CSF55]|uniref:Uncharacterized protein n=1 Tax=Rozella allomycis (strain CSF55) TaxID=988480 RepID=A0A4P9YEN8_ROZAC|nr:hypothetical protein ROZALSC1DRAFT_24949 [Rozella allomycis CSF55]